MNPHIRLPQIPTEAPPNPASGATVDRMHLGQITLHALAALNTSANIASTLSVRDSLTAESRDEELKVDKEASIYLILPRWNPKDPTPIHRLY